MENIYFFLLYLFGAFILGSIPFAYIYVRLINGVDIRKVGSGNPGATNVARISGKLGFITVLFLDMLKGFMPVFASVMIFDDTWHSLLVAISAILGHTYSPFLKFKGGKGVATAAGASLAIIPKSLLMALLVFSIIFAIWRMVSLSSVVGAVALFVSTIIFYRDEPWLILFTLLLSLFIIYKHKDNILRILKGTENKFKSDKS